VRYFSLNTQAAKSHQITQDLHLPQNKEAISSLRTVTQESYKEHTFKEHKGVSQKSHETSKFENIEITKPAAAIKTDYHKPT
jgi:hypothetical protein